MFRRGNVGTVVAPLREYFLLPGALQDAPPCDPGETWVTRGAAGRVVGRTKECTGAGSMVKLFSLGSCATSEDCAVFLCLTDCFSGFPGTFEGRGHAPPVFRARLVGCPTTADDGETVLERMGVHVHAGSSTRKHEATARSPFYG